MPAKGQRLTRIHVRRDMIAKDRKTGQFSNAIGVETSGQRKRYGVDATGEGKFHFKYRPNNPLKCGARCWFETYGKVTVHRREVDA